MALIRKVEERIVEVYPSDKIKSPVHLSIGQEAPSVGVCRALRSSDIVFGTYRGHALYLAKGGNLRTMVAELFGKKEGCGRGKAGSMHLGDRSAGVMGTSAIVATTIPQAVGYSLAEKMREKDTVIVVFFGDGATEEGVFFESLNFASLMKLPILFVCENNLYAINTPASKRVLRPNYCDRAESLGVGSLKIGSSDVRAIYDAAYSITNRIRHESSGPAFLEIETYRWKEHVGPGEDWDLGYRTKDEGDVWIKNDALKKLESAIDDSRRSQLLQRIDQEIEGAFNFAEAGSFPEGLPDLYRDVFA